MHAIENERYLQACGRYIEDNPVVAGSELFKIQCQDEFLKALSAPS